MHKTNENRKIKKTGRKLFKRLLPIFMIIPLLVTFTFQLPQLAEANFISKAVTTSAKKIIKEVTKDAAVNEAMNIIYQKQMGDLEKKLYEIPDDYEAVCFEHATQKCKKPAAVKKLTTADKKLIGDKVGDLLDQRAGMTPFKKFLDWFAPVFLIGFTVSALQYAFDSDFRSFINDIAMQALYDLGFITPLSQVTVVTDRPTFEQVNEDYSPSPSRNVQTINSNQSYNPIITLDNSNNQLYNKILQSRLTTSAAITQFKISFLTSDQQQLFFMTNNNYDFLIYMSNLTQSVADQYSLTTIINDVPQTTKTYLPEKYYANIFSGTDLYTSYLNVFTPYEQNGKIIFEISNDQTGQKLYQIQIPKKNFDVTKINKIEAYAYTNSIANGTHTLKLEDTTIQRVQIPLPTITEVTTYTDPLETSIYKKDETKIYIPSPKTQEFTTEDGKKLTPSPTSPGIFIDEQGNEVPDDDVIVSDPKVTPNPDGSVTHTPEPTPENPNPQPEEIVPPKTEPPNNFPFELVIALLKLLKVSLAYMVHIFKFFIGLSTLPEKEIPFEMFQQFKTFKPFNFPIYATVQGMALFFTTFTLYRFIRRMF